LNWIFASQSPQVIDNRGHCEPKLPSAALLIHNCSVQFSEPFRQAMQEFLARFARGRNHLVSDK
jgi:hypothetical protein